MKKNPLRDYASAIYNNGLFDENFIQYMADMSYSGNIDLAFKKVEGLKHNELFDAKKLNKGHKH